MFTDNTTYINAIGLAFGLLAGVLMVFVPRRYALLPVIAMICFMTMGQRILVFGLNFTLIRILLLFGWLRVIARGEVRAIKLNPIDRVLIYYVISAVITYTLLWQTWEAFINRMGLAYNAIGLYFLFRLLVRDLDEVRRVAKLLALAVIPLAGSMVLERMTGRNPFGIFGGVPLETLVRDGVLRCQGPFAHPILAGTFGATVLPIFIGLWWQRGSSRFLAFLAILASVLITVAAASSGPVLAGLFGLVGLCFWPLRKRMRLVRWGVALTILGLHLVMKAPVWFLIARVGIFAGSTGYHRAFLIDRAIAHFFDWWLVGTYSTEDWGYYLFDVTNQYVLVAIEGGLITLVLFIAIIARCFGGVGRAVQTMEGESPGDQRLVWALGAALLTHVVNYLSVPYFDQNFVNWYLLLAMISMASGVTRQAVQEAAHPGGAHIEVPQALDPVLNPSGPRSLSRLQGRKFLSVGGH